MLPKHPKTVASQAPINAIELKQIARLGDQQYPSFELKRIYAYLSAHGHGDWCQSAIQTLALEDIEKEDFIASHKALEGLKLVVDEFFEPTLGSKIADTYELSDFGLVGLALKNASTLLEAFDIMQSYYELLGSFTDIANIQDGNTFTNRLINVSSLDDRLVHLIFELTVSGIAKFGKEISQQDVPIEVLRFKLKLTEAEKCYFEEKYSCRVEDSAKFNESVFDIERLSLPILSATPNADTIRTTINELNLLIDTLKQEFALVDQIDQLVRRQDESFPDSKFVAESLGMSERTFRRKLNKIGVNYNLLMSKIRSQLAIAMLQEGGHTNEDIAFELNFSDAANFCNAFKKWTGNTPNYYREKKA